MRPNGLDAMFAAELPQQVLRSTPGPVREVLIDQRERRLAERDPMISAILRTRPICGRSTGQLPEAVDDVRASQAENFTRTLTGQKEQLEARVEAGQRI